MTRSAPSPEERNGGGIQVISRAAAILRELGDHQQGLSLSQIAKGVGLARATVQRIVNALAAEDFLVPAGPNGGVRLGPGLARLAQSVSSNTVEVIRPHLRTLGEEVGETVDLAILSGGSVIFVDQVQSRQQRLVALSAIGERFPLHCTANGKAVLACFSESDADQLIAKSIAEHPDYPIRSREALRREIARTRKTHLAFDLEEHGGGISAVGTAFLDVMGRPIAVSIPVPTQRFEDRKAPLAERLLAFREQVRPLVTR